MICRQAKDLMADAWHGAIDREREPEFRLHLESCEECRSEMAALSGLWDRLADLPAPEPTHDLDLRWQTTLAALSAAGSAKQKERAPSWRRWMVWLQQPVWQGAIALALLMIGLVVGLRVGTHSARSDDEIARLREEVASTREMVALSLLRQDSAAERLRGVDYSGRMPTLEPAVTEALVSAVEHDSSVNVRLAAIDALLKAAGTAGVVQSLAQSLPRQESPMVQAALVDYLVDARDRQAISTLERVAAQPELNPAVKERIRLAIGRLSQ